MKTTNILRSVVTLAFIFLCFGCSTETNNENINESSNLLKPSLLLNACAEENTITIYAIYDFTGLNQLQQQALKYNFENAMSQYFVICSVDPSSCTNVDFWTVNLKQYQDYIDEKTNGGSTSSGHENNGELKTPDEYITNCD